ncbi:tetratricopeptide repeat protein 12 [Toxorhynchites rutilus septentrionalis]|uniref:tetratricopeptide repeat protein 12 n=1 Tax=Toxorhynchites rutilus septentrionalis TaxID=329112 RepID=UPI002478FD22|nr:tetratricopeptide repeat protein 12 [Toxorhynchites rutilus septentrionalis]
MSRSREDEDFDASMNKVDEVMKILSMMTSGDKNKEQMGLAFADRFLGTDKQAAAEKIDVNNFIVRVNQERTVVNKKDDSMDKPMADKFAFMADIERDAARRASERKEREQVAQGLRRAGNRAFRREEYEKAISMYTKAIDQIRDSPILYNNRALAYIKIRMYKRAIIDCDFVISKLDEKNLRSWIYRAQGYYLLGKERDYEKSISEAKKHNPKELDYIDRIVLEIEGKTIMETTATEESGAAGGTGDTKERTLPMDDVQSISSNGSL